MSAYHDGLRRVFYNGRLYIVARDWAHQEHRRVTSFQNVDEHGWFHGRTAWWRAAR